MSFKDMWRSFMNEKFFTPERIAKMQKYVLEHPIDHSLDEACEYYDCTEYEQMAARGYYEVLRELGKLPPGIE